MLTLFAFFCVLGLTASISNAPAAAAVVRTPGDRVVIVLAPYLSWSDISQKATPAMWELARSGGVANINTQVGGVQSGTSVEAGALTISAGRWALNAPGAPPPYDRSELASRTFALLGGAAGEEASSAAIAYGGFPAADKRNSATLDQAHIGTLGTFAHLLGMTTVAIGNSDEPGTPGGGFHRPAALVAMDNAGLVDSGTVSANLLVPDGTLPFITRTNEPLFMATLQRYLGPRGPRNALVVVDPGDLLRAYDGRGHNRPPEVAKLEYDQAVGLLDRTVAKIRTTSPRATVMVVGLIESRTTWSRPGLGPLIIGGVGNGSGALTSNTTKRAGLVSNLDIAVTAIDRFSGRPVQSLPQTNGDAISAVPNTSVGGDDSALAARLGRLGQANAAFLATDAVLGGVLDAWLALAVAALLAAAVAVARGGARWRSAAEVALLGVFSVPAGSILASWLPRFPASGAVYVAALVGWSAVVFATALAVRSRVPWPPAPAAFVAAVTALFVTAGQLFGAHAPFGETTLFGYSVLTGWRYYGAGNEISAIAIACVLVSASLAAKPRRALVVGVLGAVVVAVLVLPGAQAGVAVWGTVGVAVACAAAVGERVRTRNIESAFAIAALIAIALISLDALTGGTHISRLVGTTASGGTSVLFDTVRRKAADAFFFSLFTPYQFLAYMAAGVLVWLRWGRRRVLDGLMRGERGLAPGVIGAIVAGGFALVTEDSGISMPALLWGFAAFAVLYIALSVAYGRPSGTMTEPDYGNSDEA